MQSLLCFLYASDFVARQAARLLGASSRIAEVSIHFGLDISEPSSDAAQLSIQFFAELIHLKTAEFAVDDVRQISDDAPPLVVLQSKSKLLAGALVASHSVLIYVCRQTCRNVTY